MRRVAVFSLVAVLILLSAGQARLPGYAMSCAPRPLTLWLDWYPNSDHAGIYVALAKGYYARAGLAVTPRVPTGAAEALTLVSHGTGDLAVSYEPTVLLARAQGLPVVATAAIVRHPLDCAVALAGSGITRPRQLQGKVVGVAGLPTDYTNLAAIVRHDGGDLRRVKVVVVGYGLLPNLLARRVDAVLGVYWTWEVLQAEQQGYRVNVMRLDQNGVPAYDELVFATSAARLQTEAATVRAFQRATFQGYAYAVAHPAEAARILLRVPGVLSHSKSLIERSIRLLSPLFHDERGRYGTLSAARWQTYADWMTRTRLLRERLNARAALTTALLP